MIIGILIGLSLLLMILSFGYLSYENAKGETCFEKIQTAINNNRKVLIYNIIALVVMSIISVVLVKTYLGNTLIDNMKILTLLAILVTVTITDIRKQIIPNQIILIGIVLRVAYAVAEFVTLGSEYFAILKSDLLSLGLVVALLLLGVFIVKNGIGMGDIKLILIMGIFQGITGVISSLFFSLFVSFLVAVFMLITKMKTRKDTIEFAPSVLAGTIISIILTGM